MAIDIANKIDAEIINADSMQIYKDLNILSAQPSTKEMSKIKHHLFGEIEITKSFSVGIWINLVKKKIKLINSLGKIAILVGGTGLYLNSAMNGISKIPNIDESIKNKTNDLFLKLGRENFFNYFCDIDPEGSQNILPSDTQRLMRACQIILQTQKSIIWWQKYKHSKPILKKSKSILLLPDKSMLYSKINERFDGMLDLGLMNEIKSIKIKNLSLDLPGMKALGLKHLLQYLDGMISFDEAINLAKRDNRRYAKRQITWFKNSFKSDFILNSIYNRNNVSIFDLEKIVKIYE